MPYEAETTFPAALADQAATAAANARLLAAAREKVALEGPKPSRRGACWRLSTGRSTCSGRSRASPPS